jgi:hypothetical protein
MLTVQHVRTINKTRDLLEKLEARCADHEEFRKGKLAEACKTAELALFNVLSIVSAYEETLEESALFNEKPDPDGHPDHNGGTP